MTFAMASQSLCAVTAGGDRSSSPVNGFVEGEADVVSAPERAFLIGVAGGTASGKVFVLFFSTLSRGSGKLRKAEYIHAEWK